MRGVVKRFGPITAVDGLDLEVPEGSCVGLLGPNGAGKSTTMRMLTAQAIADEGELEVLGRRLPEDSKQARAECGVVPQLDNLDVTLTVEQNLIVFAYLYRLGRGERRAAVDRALEIANLTDRADTRVDKLSGGMRRRLLIARALVHRPRLVLLDEPTVGLDPQVRQELWALIDRLRSEGTSVLMSTHYIEEAERLADEVTIMSHGKAVARGAPMALIEEHAGREAVEIYGSPARLAEVEAQARAAGHATRRTGTSIAVLRLNGDAPEGERRPANLEDVFVLLDGRGDRMSGKVGRLERPALLGVLMREVINFSSYWRSTTFSATVEPTIYLLAFGFGFGSLVSTVGGYDYVEFVGTGTVATAVLFSSAFAAMFGTFIKYKFQRTYDAILAAPVDTEELVTAEAAWIAFRAGVYGCVPMLVAIVFGLAPAWGMLLVPFFGAIAGFGWACFGILASAMASSIENFNYIISAGLTPLFLVAGTFFPLTQLPDWAQNLAQLNPLYHLVQLVRHAAFGFDAWADVGHVAVLVGFGVLMWRLAIWRLQTRLVD